MAHIVVASFGEANLFLFDLKRHCITAQVSTTLAEHTEFWQRTFLPIAAGVLGATIGILPVHSACLSRNGNGILIAGDSGVGKSTLAVALAQRQFDYISDDWTYCTGKTGILKAHGTGAPVKLLPNTINLFPLLREFTTHVTMNGEMAYEVQADTVFGAHIQKQCTPRALLFYKRDNTAASRITRLSQAESRSYLEANVERLPDVLSQAAATRNRLMDTVAALPCWQITCTGTPQANAASVEAFYQQQEQRWIQ